MPPLLLSLLLADGLLVGVAPRATPPAAAAEADASFTVVVLPDLQGYTVSSTYAATATAQTQWIADQADDLDVAVVAQVGDLVETHPIPEQWTRASTSMKVLDDAGVPSAVLPGNHDMDVSTGEAMRYDASFPASRYTGASWNGPAATYVEGYRGNKNSAVTFERSGMDFMLLSLEYDPTDAVLAWARGVLAAHPEHRVILSTHSFIHTAGGRSTTTTRTDAGANTPQQVWDELVQPSCQIFLVVNGHWHDGPDRTEARRADANACGRPVQQILSDYQDRPNGGDGWLRTYRFDPAADTITAATYSPTLARYETDADSAFTLAYDMTSGTTPPPTTTPTTLVGAGSAWTYRYDNTTLPTTWNTPGFDASTWRTGNAVLGFGSTVTTNIDVPAPTTNRPRSAQLRRTFTIDDPTTLSDITLTTRADDGIALYLNGTELTRKNLPTGTLGRDTYATAAPRTSAALAAPVTVTIPASALRTGTNTLAASVHLNYRGTPDLTFDATLTAKKTD